MTEYKLRICPAATRCWHGLGRQRCVIVGAVSVVSVIKVASCAACRRSERPVIEAADGLTEGRPPLARALSRALTRASCTPSLAARPLRGIFVIAFN